jgi:hypothetical protein
VRAKKGSFRDARDKKGVLSHFIAFIDTFYRIYAFYDLSLLSLIAFYRILLKRLPTSPGVLKRLPTSPGVLKMVRGH